MTQPVALVVERLAKTGEGIAHHEGRAVFIPGALPGEHVLATVSPSDKVLHARLERVVTPSPHRRTPPCPIADRCGGCDWQHVDEATQRAEKDEIVRSTLEHLGGIARDSYQFASAAHDDKALGYRRRAVMHPVSGRLGFNAKGSHQRLVVDHCPALTAPLQAFPAALSDALEPTGLKEVDEVHLLETNGRLAVALTLKGDVKPKLSQRLEALVRSKTIAGAVLTPKSGQPTLIGKPVLTEASGVLVRPDAFAQANEAVNARLVERSIELLAPTPDDAVLELYSGNGNFSAPLAPRVRELTAVEFSPISVALALQTKAANVRVVQGDAAKIAEAIVKEGRRFDRLLLDPPRAGAPGVERWARGLGVKRVVYVACDPGALARDAAALKKAGFAPRVLQLFDLFPQTRHIEAVMAFDAV